ncbi:hypothetical protein GYMLUDRAFT_36896 [Collybiopsis luxurians FD-317 M1]|nr:hypothetical protein GYMLUDRAFT_36896 [Collybiopsis luxurians FD-317 M1]
MDPSLTPTSPQSPPLRRDKSYRKPVPEYIPSPPESPIAATFPPKAQEVTTELEEAILRPLPEDWHDIVRQAMSAQEKRMESVQDNRLTSVAPEQVVDTPRTSPSVVGTVLLRNPSFLHSPPLEGEEKLPALSTSPNSAKRRLPQIYRPPTPPTSSTVKKRKLTEDSSNDTHEFLTVPPRVANHSKNTETSTPLTRSVTAAGSSRSSFHPLSAQASSRTEKTFASDSPTFIAGSARTTSHHTDGHQEDDWHNLPVLPSVIVKPLPRRHGSGLTGSTKASSMHSQRSLSEPLRSTFQTIGRFFRGVFCCCFQ